MYRPTDDQLWNLLGDVLDACFRLQSCDNTVCVSEGVHQAVHGTPAAVYSGREEATEKSIAAAWRHNTHPPTADT